MDFVRLGHPKRIYRLCFAGAVAKFGLVQAVTPRARLSPPSGVLLSRGIQDIPGSDFVLFPTARSRARELIIIYCLQIVEHYAARFKRTPTVGCRRLRWGRPDKLPQNHRQQFWWQFRREMALSDWTELAEKFH
jgi:hypothetical protein